MSNRVLCAARSAHVMDYLDKLTKFTYEQLIEMSSAQLVWSIGLSAEEAVRLQQVMLSGNRMPRSAASVHCPPESVSMSQALGTPRMEEDSIYDKLLRYQKPAGTLSGTSSNCLLVQHALTVGNMREQRHVAAQYPYQPIAQLSVNNIHWGKVRKLSEAPFVPVTSEQALLPAVYPLIRCVEGVAVVYVSDCCQLEIRPGLAARLVMPGWCAMSVCADGTVAVAHAQAQIIADNDHIFAHIASGQRCAAMYRVCVGESGVLCLEATLDGQAQPYVLSSAPNPNSQPRCHRLRAQDLVLPDLLQRDHTLNTFNYRAGPSSAERDGIMKAGAQCAYLTNGHNELQVGGVCVQTTNEGHIRVRVPLASNHAEHYAELKLVPALKQLTLNIQHKLHIQVEESGTRLSLQSQSVQVMSDKGAVMYSRGASVVFGADGKYKYALNALVD